MDKVEGINEGDTPIETSMNLLECKQFCPKRLIFLTLLLFLTQSFIRVIHCFGIPDMITQYDIFYGLIV